MKLKDFDFRIWDKGEKTLTYASKDWKLGIGFSNPQQDNGEVESVLHKRKERVFRKICK